MKFVLWNKISFHKSIVVIKDSKPFTNNLIPFNKFLTILLVYIKEKLNFVQNI